MHPWVKGIQVCSNEGAHPFPRGDNYQIANIDWQKLINLLLQNHWANFNQTWQKHSWVMGTQVCFNKGPHPFPRVENYRIPKIHWQNLKIFFSWTTVSISTKLSKMHPWVKGIQICSNDGPRSFPGGDNNQIAKIHWRNSKIFFSRTAGPISTKFGTKHPWVKGIQVCSNEEPLLLIK